MQISISAIRGGLPEDTGAVVLEGVTNPARSGGVMTSAAGRRMSPWDHPGLPGGVRASHLHTSGGHLVIYTVGRCQ